MSTRSNLLVFGAASLILAALPTLAKAPQKAKPKTAPVETAVIVNTGSTNTKGYEITVYSTGGAMLLMKAADRPIKYSVNARKVQEASKLFRDLAAAMPLTDLPVRHGMRSASFGTRTFITYKGQQSPDLTFGGDARAATLKADIDAITQQLGVSNSPRHPAVPLNAPELQPDKN